MGNHNMNWINSQKAYNKKNVFEINVRIGKLSRIGIGASVSHNLQINQNVTIGANSFVNKNCEANKNYYGTPIKIYNNKKNKQS